MEPSSTSYHSQGLVRAIAILRELGSATSARTLSDLASSLELPKPTLVRLLKILEEHDFVHRDADGYAIGHAILDLGENYRRQANTADVAAPYLRELATATGLTANLGVLEGRWVLHVVVEEPDRPLRFRSASGSLDHTYSTGLGKMLMSALPTEALAEHLPAESPWPRFTEHTITDLDAMVAELAVIRERGCSVDQQERDLGVICMAVPIPNLARLNVALSIAGPSGELGPAEREQHLPLLQRVAADLGNNARFITALRAAHGAHSLEIA